MMNDPINEDACWQAVVQRDHLPDRKFVYAVSSTGIYCRPGCPSRVPRRDNVRFFEDATVAEAAGFRACKRCKPGAGDMPRPYRDAILRTCHRLAREDNLLTLVELAADIGMSPGHFQRLFKAEIGVTPKQFAMSARRIRLRDALGHAGSVTDAIYAAGYGASSRAYAEAAALGMTPGSFRAGSPDERIRFQTAVTTLGPLLIAATDAGLCMVEFGERVELEAIMRRRFPKAEFLPADAAFNELAAQVVAFIDDTGSDLDLPLDLRGTAFQARVWQELRMIPRGEAVSYAELARRIGQPSAARAVAGACAANCLAVVIPCHRIVRQTGDISGYRWGVDRKRALLARERGMRTKD